jgi:hypothetical protein
MTPMSDPEPWQATAAAAPFVTIEKPRGTVSIWSLGSERFLVQALGEGSEVEGYREARALAHGLAGGLE